MTHTYICIQFLLFGSISRWRDSLPSKELTNHSNINIMSWWRIQMCVCVYVCVCVCLSVVRRYRDARQDWPENKRGMREHALLGTTIMKLIVKCLLTLHWASGQTLWPASSQSLLPLFFFFFCSRQYPKTTSHNKSLPKSSACLHACMYSIVCNFPIGALFVLSHVADCRTDVVCLREPVIWGFSWPLLSSDESWCWSQRKTGIHLKVVFVRYAQHLEMY